MAPSNKSLRAIPEAVLAAAAEGTNADTTPSGPGPTVGASSSVGAQQPFVVFAADAESKKGWFDALVGSKVCELYSSLPAEKRRDMETKANELRDRNTKVDSLGDRVKQHLPAIDPIHDGGGEDDKTTL